jgi:hypothetical protein
MPRLNNYKCNKCGYDLPFCNTRGDMYVSKDSGERISCGHPGELYTVAKVLGYDDRYSIPSRVLRRRTGFLVGFLCMDCLESFTLDIKSWDWHIIFPIRRDKRQCPFCWSRRIKSVGELIDAECPKCHEGKIEELWTGVIT